MGITPATQEEMQASMEFYDNAPPALRALLLDFDIDDIVKAGTAIGTNDYEVIGRFLRATERMSEGKKRKIGEAFLREKGLIKR